jgi:hypothetical protein
LRPDSEYEDPGILGFGVSILEISDPSLVLQ